jgi:hypothetical protein
LNAVVLCQRTANRIVFIKYFAGTALGSLSAAIKGKEASLCFVQDVEKR